MASRRKRLNANKKQFEQQQNEVSVDRSPQKQQMSKNLSQKFEQSSQNKFESTLLQKNQMYYGQRRKQKLEEAQEKDKIIQQEKSNPLAGTQRRKRNNIPKKSQNENQIELGPQKPSQKIELFNLSEKKIQEHHQQNYQKQQTPSDVIQERDENIQIMIKKKQNEEQSSEEEKYISFKDILNGAKNNYQLRKKIFYSPIGQKQKGLCYYKRYSSGFSETYQIIGQDLRPLLFCQNQRGSIGCNMYISMTKQMDKNSSSYLGKLRGNATGSVYDLYDAGQPPNSKLDRSAWRTTMAHIEYQSNFLGMKGPRKLKVITPTVKSYQDWDLFKLAQNQLITNFSPPLTSVYRNKQPKWNQKMKSYALNFGGRVKLASIKNFILLKNQIPPEAELPLHNNLVFGKIDDHTFSLEYSHPFSLFQAFGIAVSAFDFKYNCQ